MAGQSAERPIMDQERFPLPDSLYDPEFHTWAQDLDRNSQLQLEREMMTWYLKGLKAYVGMTELERF